MPRSLPARIAVDEPRERVAERLFHAVAVRVPGALHVDDLRKDAGRFERVGRRFRRELAMSAAACEEHALAAVLLEASRRAEAPLGELAVAAFDERGARELRRVRGQEKRAVDRALRE